ncbi:DUF3306 domain-containing protein [Thauera sp. JM12B12]|uniref:DUF3306 domain-containing protein n=1 Tax=Thauera sp. JM12B12 TaxID=3142262 RepID=UPI0031F3BFF9
MSGGFLSRWSRRKLAAAVQQAVQPDPGSTVAAEVTGSAGAVEPAAPGSVVEPVSPPSASPEAQLPPIEGLSLSSDFTAFLKEEVSEALRRKALQKLFSDPHFNRMDGLDIYIDDYSQPDPIPPEMMAKLQHAREWLQANAPAADAEAVLPGDAASVGAGPGVGGAAPPGPSGSDASEDLPLGAAATELGPHPGAGALGACDAVATPDVTPDTCPDTRPDPLTPRQKAP